MNDLALGEFVYSDAGRDRGMCFIVMGISGNYVMLANGKQRKLDKPKKKKYKHVISTRDIDIGIAQKILNKESISNSEIRKSISNYRAEREG